MSDNASSNWGAKGWIMTASGKLFWPLQPRVEDIDILDIAHSLSMQCRYGGHTRTFYSVAQHSVLVSYECEPEHALWGLLHDAAEAYLVDLPKPIKNQLPDYVEAEERLMRAICQRFGLPEEMPKSVDVADRTLYVTEVRDLMPNREAWKQYTSNLCAPLSMAIDPCDAKIAHAQFLTRFNALML